MIDISVVIPFYNESDSLPELIDRLLAVLDALDRKFEILLIDDGSSDNGFQIVRQRRELRPEVRGIRLRSNFGKAAALAAGFSESTGAIVITMDADLQDDPKEIPRFLDELDKDFDLVSGWKQVRHDPLEKRLPSKLFNAMTCKLTGVKLHDFNCGFKAYRREVLTEISLYGDLHRFIPALAAGRGFRVGEIAVEHHARQHGKSKYGIERYTRGFLDLLTVLTLTRFSRRPAHLFGGGGVLLSAAGLLINFYMTVLWVVGERPIGNRPLFFLGILLLIVGVQFISLGLLAEIITRSLARDEHPYSIAERIE
ncbi:MAG: glycosyltransferase family 2 protein [Candidatus Alcyoniella australis]|nr:glycosyltransferase family 2 protein [Candidatus Alcyoniella australis]